MEAMRTAYAQNGAGANDPGTHASVVEIKAGIVCEQHFISLNRLMNSVVKVLFECVIHLINLIGWAEMVLTGQDCSFDPFTPKLKTYILPTF